MHIQIQMLIINSQPLGEESNSKTKVFSDKNLCVQLITFKITKFADDI